MTHTTENADRPGGATGPGSTDTAGQPDPATTGPAGHTEPAAADTSGLTEPAPTDTSGPTAPGSTDTAAPTEPGSTADGTRADSVERRTSPPGSFTSRSPVTGEALAAYPVHGPLDVDRAVRRARAAGTRWAALSAGKRRGHLLRWKRELASSLDTVAGIVAAETGKPRQDAELELLLTLEHLSWAARNAGRVLRRRRVRSGAVAMHQAATVVRRPLGVVGVIGPWNYPVYTPMGSIGYALAAGNAVVFKPSEYTPGTGVLLAELFDAAVPGYAGLFTVVTGAAATGGALARSGVDKVAFTGSPGTARKVMAVCAESLTPFLAECGGKDAVIVTAGADLDAAADAIVWGAMGNAGQTCAGVERVYAVRQVHAALCEKVVERARGLRPGAGPDAAYGPMTMPDQTAVVRRHVQDALAAGAGAALGGSESAPAAGAFVEPVVLVDVPEDSPAMTEETFGPTVAVNAVADEDEAVRRANASRYALGAAVFGGSRRAGAALASRLRAGAVSVDSVLGFAAVPALPFGGSGDSGFGRIHGADGLRAFTTPQSVTVRRFAPPVDLTSFATPAATKARAVALMRWLHSRR
ncbi:aldehyde dehydrogenase family protein [Streptomyces sp. Root1310]|uniref:aldehyde dehydrogenase family protein n=1 Tax=Streptomyces sp. Root1310 TaxID=1736452 RepID=UPI00070DDEC6|nr:aldehyde dehydrogenase family protein [Streptomyces sp. Root1310]KQX65280.1 aldehyde dehydrogenase [Streptomyces sp. Root1310]